MKKLIEPYAETAAVCNIHAHYSCKALANILYYISRLIREALFAYSR